MAELMATGFVFPAYPPSPLSSPAGRKGGANSHIWLLRFGYGTTGSCQLPQRRLAARVTRRKSVGAAARRESPLLLQRPNP